MASFFIQKFQVKVIQLHSVILQYCFRYSSLFSARDNILQRLSERELTGILKPDIHKISIVGTVTWSRPGSLSIRNCFCDISASCEAVTERSDPNGPEYTHSFELLMTCDHFMTLPAATPRHDLAPAPSPLRSRAPVPCSYIAHSAQMG